MSKYTLNKNLGNFQISRHLKWMSADASSHNFWNHKGSYKLRGVKENTNQRK